MNATSVARPASGLVRLQRWLWWGLFLVVFEVFLGCLVLWWHPLFVSGLLALPLCGAALTFFAAAKKVSKESGLTPQALVIACGPPTALSCPRHRYS
ncbi:hypothetical protein [Paraburkholderia sp. C35]|uniref:hypothetical protein n=1 Tax=Paraburkholderia sp. C35 TaxID=2126993 RepID=UPI0013A5A411|nr:hypothetical protein [Paraburkholderia sp. C35]